MARDFAKIGTSLWRSRKFKKLSEGAKLFYIYALSSPHSNSCGCYTIHIGYMMADLDKQQSEIEGFLWECEAADLIVWDAAEYTLYCKNWFRFNEPQNPKHAKKLVSDLESIPYRKGIGENPASACAAELKGFLVDKGWKIEKPLMDRIDRVSRLDDTETETETETETIIKPQLSEDDKIDPPEFELFSDAPEVSPPETQMAFSIYNDFAKKAGWKTANVLNDQRRSSLKLRLKECGGLDEWKKILERCTNISHFQGNNERGWKAHFDFFLQPKSFIKIMEGVYDETSGNNRQGTSKSDRAKDAILRGIEDDIIPEHDPDTGEIIELTPDEIRS